MRRYSGKATHNMLYLHLLSSTECCRRLAVHEQNRRRKKNKIRIIWDEQGSEKIHLRYAQLTSETLETVTTVPLKKLASDYPCSKLPLESRWFHDAYFDRVDPNSLYALEAIVLRDRTGPGLLHNDKPKWPTRKWPSFGR